MRVLIVEDEADGGSHPRRPTSGKEIAGGHPRVDDDGAVQLLGWIAKVVAVLDRDIAGPSGDEITEAVRRCRQRDAVSMLTAADRLDDKATGFELGADDYLTKPPSFASSCSACESARPQAHPQRPPVRDRRICTRPPSAASVLPRRPLRRTDQEAVCSARGPRRRRRRCRQRRRWFGARVDESLYQRGAPSAVSGLRKRLGEPWLIKPWPASATASTQDKLTGARVASVDPSPRVERSSQAHATGFVMLAGGVLLAAGYFSLSRGVHPGVIFMVRSHADLLRDFAPISRRS